MVYMSQGWASNTKAKSLGPRDVKRRPTAPTLVEPTPAELRLLPQQAVELWKALVRFRDSVIEDDCYEYEWFTVSLHELQARARIRSYGSAKNALAILRRAGLVSCSHSYDRNRWFRSRKTGELEQGNARAENNYLIAGGYSRRSGVDRLRFPARAWKEFVAARMNVPLHDVLVEAPYYEDREEVDEETAKYLRGFGRKNKKLGREYVTSVYTQLLRNCSSLSKQREEVPKAFFLSKEGSEIDYAAILASNPHKHPPPTGTCPWRNPDQVTKTCLQKSFPDLDRTQDALREIVRAYNTAVERVYGVNPFMFAKAKDLTKVRGAAFLAASAAAFVDHGISPLHWAIWRLRYARDKRGQKKPLPLFVIMSPKTVHKMAGWFRKDYVLPQEELVVDPLREEQRLRNLEANRRWRGFTGAGVWMTLPPWYAEKRKLEIIQGNEDPYDMWPTREFS